MKHCTGVCVRVCRCGGVCVCVTIASAVRVITSGFDCREVHGVMAKLNSPAFDASASVLAAPLGAHISILEPLPHHPPRPPHFMRRRCLDAGNTPRSPAAMAPRFQVKVRIRMRCRILTPSPCRDLHWSPRMLKQCKKGDA